MEKRFCIICQKEIIKTPSNSKKYYATRKFCSTKCFAESIKKQPTKEQLLKKEIKSFLLNYPGNHPIHNTWNNMKARCNNKNRDCYYNYGGRGISICESWNKSYFDFGNWALANGWKPGLTLERINNDGNYCPENCKWATRKEQLRNRRNTVYLTYEGQKKSLKDWCDIFNLSYGTLTKRYHKNKDPNFILGTPINKSYSRDMKNKRNIDEVY